MRRHELDPLALVAGLVFLAVAALVATGNGHLLGARGVLPVILVGIGAVGLLSGSRFRRRRRELAPGMPTLAERAEAGRLAREQSERPGHDSEGRTQ